MQARPALWPSPIKASFLDLDPWSMLKIVVPIKWGAEFLFCEVIGVASFCHILERS